MNEEEQTTAIPTDVPEEIEEQEIQDETEAIQEITISDYNLGSYVAMGLGASGACVLFSIMISVIINLFRRM